MFNTNLNKYSGPGVYRFSDTNKRIIYVGSASNIYSRLHSHFSSKGSNVDKEAYKSTAMVQIIKTDKFKDDSFGMALSIENYFIRKYMPRYNKRDKPKNIFYDTPLNEEFEKLYWADCYRHKSFEEDKKRNITILILL